MTPDLHHVARTLRRRPSAPSRSAPSLRQVHRVGCEVRGSFVMFRRHRVTFHRPSAGSRRPCAGFHRPKAESAGPSSRCAGSEPGDAGPASRRAVAPTRCAACLPIHAGRMSLDADAAYRDDDAPLFAPQPKQHLAGASAHHGACMPRRAAAIPDHAVPAHCPPVVSTSDLAPATSRAPLPHPRAKLLSPPRDKYGRGLPAVPPSEPP